VVKTPVPNPAIEAVLFDLDDTLLNSLWARVHALEHVFTEFRIPLNAKDYLFGLNGSPFRDGMKNLEREYQLKDDLFIKYRRAYWFNSRDSLSLYPGVKEMLNRLKSGGYYLGIVTSKMHDAIFEGCRIGCNNELTQMDIDGLFSIVVGLEDVQKPKPDPECIRLALKGTGVSPAHTLVVGDTAADIQAARTAGCLSCHAVWGITESVVEPLTIPADYTAHDPADILRFLGEGSVGP
jgi:pyrophosphatase PpaX